MTTSLMSVKARASPGSDARRSRLAAVSNGRGLLVQGRNQLKTLAQRKEVPLRIATLNVGTLTGRSRELADVLKRRKVDIACVQETRWKGQKSREIGDGYKLIYHGISNRNGVAVVVCANLRQQVAKVNRHSDRLINVVIDMPSCRLHIISAYAPQTGCDESEKDQFWQELQDLVLLCPQEDFLLVCGDLNGHVGRNRDGYGCHGGNGYGGRNDDGCRVLDFAEANNLIVGNTFFKKRTSHLITYISGDSRSQIDFILVRHCNFRAVIDVKVIPSDYVAPQHKLLTADLRISKCRIGGYTGGLTKIKWWKLQDQKSALVGGVTFPPVDSYSIDTTWTSLCKSVTTAAAEMLGTTKPGRRHIDKQTWLWTAEVQDKVQDKKRKYKNWLFLKTDENREKYVTAKRAAKRAVADARANHYNNLYLKLDTKEGEKDIYRLARARARSARDIEHYVCIKCKEGKRLQSKQEILKRWQQHFKEISNMEYPHPPIPEGVPTEGPIPHITANEVSTALKSMKNQKSPGPDNLPADFWKLQELQDTAIDWLVAFFNAILDSGRIPTDWATSITVPIFKNGGDPAECSNYRPVRLLSHTMKIFEKIFDQRLRETTKVNINQCGFVKGAGTTDAIFAARLLMEKHREKRKPLHIAFLDLEKAFDRVPHGLIWYALRDHGVPESLVNVVRMLYTNTSSSVRCAVGTSESFPVNVGVHQGSALSPCLFVLVMDTVMRDLQRRVPWTILYADDVMVADVTREKLQCQVVDWNDRLSQYGLRLNVKKTEHLELNLTDGAIQVAGENLIKTTSSRYLGSRLQSDGNFSDEVRARVNAAWLRWKEVTGVLCDKKMPLRLKSKIYKTVIRPVALYGVECRPSDKISERQLHAMEMRMLRWAMGISLTDHVRNDTIREQMGVVPIADKMREKRLRWYGHALRAAPGTVANSVLYFEVEGQRPRGRPKKRWQDTINTDLKIEGLRPTDAYERTKWRSMTKKADPAPAGQR